MYVRVGLLPLVPVLITTLIFQTGKLNRSGKGNTPGKGHYSNRALEDTWSQESQVFFGGINGTDLSLSICSMGRVRGMKEEEEKL